MRKLIALLVAAFGMISVAPAQSPSASGPKTGATYTVEYYYKVKWGYQDEFLRLFQKNHYPLLKKQVEMGRMLSVSMVAPENHMTEDARWDFRVTIVFRNDANAPKVDEDALKKQLFPDQGTYAKEEQRRFEILLAHWDLPLATVDMEKPAK